MNRSAGDPRAPLQLAIHEAGHAVASVRLGTGFRFVTTDPDRLLRGIAAGWIDTDKGPCRAADEIIVSLAGYFAERKAGLVDQQQAEFNADMDFRKAQRNLPRSVVQLHHLVRRTEDLIEEHWEAILSVAFNLVACPYLDAEQVRSILETGYCPRKQPPSMPPELASVDTSELEAQLAVEVRAINDRQDKRMVEFTVRRRGWPHPDHRRPSQTIQPAGTARPTGATP